MHVVGAGPGRVGFGSGPESAVNDELTPELAPESRPLLPVEMPTGQMTTKVPGHTQGYSVLLTKD